MINETIQTIVTSLPETPFNEVEEFGEVIHSVCVDAIKNADYDIGMYPFDTATIEDKFAAYIFTLQYACRGGFASLLIDLDPMMFDVDHQDLLLAMLSIAKSFVKSRNPENIEFLEFVEKNPIGEIPGRILDKFVTYFSIVHGFENVPNFNGIDMRPLQSLYYSALVNADDIDDSPFNMGNIYKNILAPESFNTSEDLNTAMLILKVVYGRAFLANPIDLVSWMMPEEGDTEITPLPDTLIGRIYTIHVSQLAQTNIDRDQVEAYMTGNISAIDPVMAGSLATGIEETINDSLNDTDDQKIADSIKDIYHALIDTLINGLVESYSQNLNIEASK